MSIDPLPKPIAERLRLLAKLPQSPSLQYILNTIATEIEHDNLESIEEISDMLEEYQETNVK